MDITRENFAASLERVRAAISRSSFLALDCEFSGLTTGGNTCQYDSPEERYRHLRQTASGFLVIQFGLAAFTLDKERGRYTQETFNFYLFPRHPSQGAFYCQPSSLEFLLSNGFDFNRLIRDGVPYLRPPQVEALREQLERQLQEAESPASLTTTPAGTVPDNQTEFVDRAICQIEKFLESSDEHLEFYNLSRYQRKLLYDHVGTRVETALELETQRSPGGQRSLRVCRALSGEERQLRRRQRLEQRVDEAAGFARVIKAVSESGKPVVGHNMLLDLIHLIEQFICPLPESYADFKSIVHCVFPTLVDTKVMGSTQPFRDLVPATSLGEMAVCLGTHPFSMPTVVAAEGSSGPEYGLKDNKHHEAGYDAFLTASCFAAMVSYLGLLLKPPQTLLEPTADIVRPFANKIFAMRMVDMPYLNLTGEDLAPSRDHVFYLTFPSVWRTSDIIQLFSPFSRVHVAWVDDTSAFVSLDRRNQTSQVLQNVKATGMFTLCTYSQWQAGQRMARSAGVTKPKAAAERPAVHSTAGTQPAGRGSRTTTAAATSSHPSSPAGVTSAAQHSPTTTAAATSSHPSSPTGVTSAAQHGPDSASTSHGQRSLASGAEAEAEQGPASGTKATPQKDSASHAKTSRLGTDSGAKSPAVQTPVRPAGKKRKLEASGCSERGSAVLENTAAKANTDLFTVPDW